LRIHVEQGDLSLANQSARLAGGRIRFVLVRRAGERGELLDFVGDAHASESI
jgi:hypothetical protein